VTCRVLADCNKTLAASKKKGLKGECSMQKIGLKGECNIEKEGSRGSAVWKKRAQVSE
jgi:hypothetical protein